MSVGCCVFVPSGGKGGMKGVGIQAGIVGSQWIGQAFRLTYLAESGLTFHDLFGASQTSRWYMGKIAISFHRKLQVGNDSRFFQPGVLCILQFLLVWECQRFTLVKIRWFWQWAAGLVRKPLFVPQGPVEMLPNTVEPATDSFTLLPEICFEAPRAWEKLFGKTQTQGFYRKKKDPPSMLPLAS